MEQQNSTRPDEPPRERFDLAEPIPQPDANDVIEGVTAALEAAVDLSKPHQTAARTLTLLTRLNAAVLGHVTPDECLLSLRRLMADWRTS